MVHHGMIKVMPFYHTIPKRGHTVRAIFGDRIEFGDIIEWYERNQANTDAFDYPREEDLYIAITDRVYEKLVGLDKRLVEIEQEEGAPVQC
jgi:hypothetical protein